MRNIFSAAAVSVMVAGATPAASMLNHGADADAFFSIQDSLTHAVIQDFEGQNVGQIGKNQSLKTNDGQFTFGTIGGKGSGQSVIGNGENVAIREGVNFGRTNTTRDGNQWLDSNDTRGILVDVRAADAFNTLLFSVTDPGDAQGFFTIFANGDELFSLGNGQLNGNITFFEISFDELVQDLSLSFLMLDHKGNQINDGFGIDDFAIGKTAIFTPDGDDDPLAPVPLPAAAWMLIAGLVGVGWVGRKRA